MLDNLSSFAQAKVVVSLQKVPAFQVEGLAFSGGKVAPPTYATMIDPVYVVLYT